VGRRQLTIRRTLHCIRFPGAKVKMPLVYQVKAAAAVISIPILTASSAALGADYSAVAQLPGGLDLQVLDRALSCNGGPGAFVFREGQKIDQTCNVKITKKGVTVLFAAYGKRVFIPKEQFTDPIPQP